MDYNRAYPLSAAALLLLSTDNIPQQKIERLSGGRKEVKGGGAIHGKGVVKESRTRMCGRAQGRPTGSASMHGSLDAVARLHAMASTLYGLHRNCNTV